MKQNVPDLVVCTDPVALAVARVGVHIAEGVADLHSTG